jgi:hypothetical protein
MTEQLDVRQLQPRHRLSVRVKFGLPGEAERLLINQVQERALNIEQCLTNFLAERLPFFFDKVGGILLWPAGRNC